MAMSDPTQVMKAVRSGMIRQGEGRPRMVVTAGKTTAHAGSDIVRDHPHLWAPLEVDHPYTGGDDPDGRTVGANPEPRRVEADPATAGDFRPGDPVFNDRAGRVFGIAEVATEPPASEDDEVRHVPAPDGADAGEQDPDGDPDEDTEPDVPDGETVGSDAEAAGQGDPDEDPDEDSQTVTDPDTKEGRQAIREWAEDHGFEVHDSGPLPKAVLEAWRKEQG
jgi:hypothetical protein